MKKECYVIPCDVLENTLPLLKEYAILYLFYYFGLDVEGNFDADFIQRGKELLESKGLLGERLRDKVVTGNIEVVDFIEEARRKAEIKVKKDLMRNVITADTLANRFLEKYLYKMNYPYKEYILVKEKSMLANLIKEYGGEKAMKKIEVGIDNWSYLTKKELTIQNLYSIREQISVPEAFKEFELL